MKKKLMLVLVTIVVVISSIVPVFAGPGYGGGIPNPPLPPVLLSEPICDDEDYCDDCSKDDDCLPLP